jgi:hypothetical protein
MYWCVRRCISRRGHAFPELAFLFLFRFDFAAMLISDECHSIYNGAVYPLCIYQNGLASVRRVILVGHGNDIERGPKIWD